MVPGSNLGAHLFKSNPVQEDSSKLYPLAAAIRIRSKPLDNIAAKAI